MPSLLVTGQTGIREDLSDLIAVADAKACPVVTMAKKGAEPINPLFQWQVDAYDAPSFSGVMSNADVTSFENKALNRQKLYGRIQKFRRAPGVDDIAANVTEVAGVGKRQEMSRSVRKALEELKRDMESAFCSDTDSQDQTTNLPYRTRGLGVWIQATAQTDLPVPSAYRTPAASIYTTAGDPSETNVQALLQSLYEQSGRKVVYSLVCGPTLRRAFTAMTRTQFGSTNVASAVRVFNQDIKDATYTSTIDVFEGDFGDLELVDSLFLARDASAATQTRRGYVLPMDKIELRYNRRPRFMPLEDQGGGPRGIVDAIAGLAVQNPLELGAFKHTS